ncbi:uncharacterized protein LOC122552548 [Chiloscyllium plagiosum]|uniref:uncharacterized protein LOC122552548 n=1 Tax=Chiloscyllium plagiosum TaxID=36176 RepID=UPI001CB885BD|nr:uncharacterized protein LOC122552548 [Chiloscyllium plagiosum]XP_043551178.1 uncharacterized protein LOC122552548 [Chiloscyllium plagiosum]
MSAEPWSLSGGSYSMHLWLFFTLSLLLFILLLISCGGCMRKSAQFSAQNNDTETKDDTHLISISQFDDSVFPNSISPATIQEGHPGSRKVSWQNDVEMPGMQDNKESPCQHSRALPEIPAALDDKGNPDGKGDPVYQTARELTAAECQEISEDPIEPSYAASDQFSLEAQRSEFIIEDDVAKEEGNFQQEKVAPVYARVSKKTKTAPLLCLPSLSAAHGNVERDEEPPPLPEKRFDLDDDFVIGEESEQILVEETPQEDPRAALLPAESCVTDGDGIVATRNGLTMG